MTTTTNPSYTANAAFWNAKRCKECGGFQAHGLGCPSATEADKGET